MIMGGANDVIKNETNIDFQLRHNSFVAQSKNIYVKYSQTQSVYSFYYSDVLTEVM